MRRPRQEYSQRVTERTHTKISRPEHSPLLQEIAGEANSVTKSDNDNHANQLNPNNDAYWESRGEEERPDDWEERAEDE